MKFLWASLLLLGLTHITTNVWAGSDISFNNLIEQGMQERESLNHDVNTLIEKESITAGNTEVVEFIGQEIQALESKSRLVESKENTRDSSF